ncbi:transposable element Tcb1 transposase [Trichonephila clavipes]|nr:transposable element Tcb1 transposase [Trichonephila clavipes]
MMCLANVYFFLDGTARQWYVNNEDALDSWEAFKNGLSGLFGDRQKIYQKGRRTTKMPSPAFREYTVLHTKCIRTLPRGKSSDERRRKVSHLMKGVVRKDSGLPRYCGLSFRKIVCRVGRNLTTVMRISDRWMQEVSARTIRRRLQQSGVSARRPLLGLPLTQNYRRLHRKWSDERRMWVAEWNEVVFTDESRICLLHHDGRIRVWRHRGEKMFNSCVIHCHTVPTPDIIAHGMPALHLLGIGASCPSLPSGLFSSPIENMWSMVAQRLTQITPPADTPDQHWQRVAAAWSVLPQEHIQSIFESMPRLVAVVISNNGDYSDY